jgi:predicted NBD/HSP70 family sugar kinase
MYITLDIGGTKCRIAGFSDLSKDSLLAIKIVEITNNWGVDYANILNEIEQLRRSEKIHEMAIGIAGVLSKDKSQLTNATNLKSWQNINLKDSFGIKFNCSVYIENDTFMAGFGEAFYGRIKKDFIYINWGTGIGGCIINFFKDDLTNNLINIKQLEKRNNMHDFF